MTGRPASSRVGIGGMDTIAGQLVPMVNEGKVADGKQDRRAGHEQRDQRPDRRPPGPGQPGDVEFIGLQHGKSRRSSWRHEGSQRFRHADAGGGIEERLPYIWAGFDAMRVICRKFNDRPNSLPADECERLRIRSRSGGAPADARRPGTAQARGARIYAEVLGGAVNCGGHRMGGSITARIRKGCSAASRGRWRTPGSLPDAIDAINGHLTATYADPVEVKDWSAALGRGPESSPGSMRPNR